MNEKTVISILRRIDAVEAELRGCEVALRGIRYELLVANSMGRLLNADGELKP